MIKLGLIGCGNWGANLLRNFYSLEGSEVKWLADADTEKLEAIKQRYPNIKLTTVFTEILEDKEIQGVIVATPPISHFAVAKQCLLAGKHVFVEKPLALRVEDAQTLVELAEAENLILMVGHLLRYHPAILKLREIIDSGELGDVFYVYSQRLNLGTIRRHENALWNLGCHDISVMLHLLRELPVQVSAMGRSYVQQGVEDTVFVNLNFPNNKMAHIHVSWLDPHKVRKLTVVGSRKMAVLDDMEKENKIVIYDKGFVIPEGNALDGPIHLREGEKTLPAIHRQEPLHVEAQHFVECIRKNKKPRTDGHEGLLVVQILEAAQKSLENNSIPVEINAEKLSLNPEGI
ncbi:MAG: Gfo/Idh/MocA family oxidoreductase [Candidatus Omnitrophica bacterium]|nr:Gfo/Idh/MocA family oxidoreductase [Candidatus Omnitrophota bacterium]